jgi:hypothetical protein
MGRDVSLAELAPDQHQPEAAEVSLHQAIAEFEKEQKEVLAHFRCRLDEFAMLGL